MLNKGWLIWAAVGLLAGCGQQKVDQAVEVQRQKFLLSDEPEDAVPVQEASQITQLPAQVVLVGRIGGVDNPWTVGQAAFVLADPTLLSEQEEHSHAGHNPDDCPFCSKKKNKMDGLALVEFSDERGQVLPIDAQHLFDLSSGQTVVVRGHAQRDEAGHLVVAAQGIYVRR